MDFLIGNILHDRYRIASLMAKKSGRRTFLAEDLQTHDSVVLKILLFGPDFTWEDLRLFEREAETLKSLNHPAIPQYIDSFEIETTSGKGFGLVQTYIKAKSLQEWLNAGRTFSEIDIRIIAEKILDILDYLHHCQPPVIHRDIKPSNILLKERQGHPVGKIYLIDFGSVQTIRQEGTITIVGTYGYMPPEQFGGHALPASDLYSLGATLIYLATGQHPSELMHYSLKIQFETVVNLTDLSIRWLQLLTSPDLATRAASARQARHSLCSANGYTSSEKHQLSAKEPAAKPFTTRIRLDSSPERLIIELPRGACYTTVKTKVQAKFSKILTILYFLVAFSLCALIIIDFDYFFYNIFYPYMLSIMGGLVAWKELQKNHRLIFEPSGDDILVKAIVKTKIWGVRQRVLFQKKLRHVSAGPGLKERQVNFYCHNTVGRFSITSDPAVIQWLSDQVSAWTNLEITYEDVRSSLSFQQSLKALLPKRLIQAIHRIRKRLQ